MRDDTQIKRPPAAGRATIPTPPLVRGEHLETELGRLEGEELTDKRLRMGEALDLPAMLQTADMGGTVMYTTRSAHTTESPPVP